MITFVSLRHNDWRDRRPRRKWPRENRRRKHSTKGSPCAQAQTETEEDSP